MRKKLVIILFISNLAGIFAQSEKRINIFFSTNQFVLSEHAKNSIDSLISTLKNNPKAFNIKIIGHTDSIGSQNYNQTLSTKRALQAKNYFLTKGYKNIKHEGCSFRNPIAYNGSDKGKEQNRRVEIIINSNIPAIKNIGGLKIKDKFFHINAKSGGEFEQPSGTKLTIPSDAFEDKNGKEITGDIEIVYREYRDPVDFIFGNIPMSYMTKGELYPFNSAGMFKILAYKNGEPIYLKKGKNIKIEFAVTENLANLNFYRFDTVSKQWAEIAKLTDQHAVNINAELIKRMPCVVINGEKTCNMEDCDALYYDVNTGIKYATSKKSIEEELKTSDSLNSLKEKIKKQIVDLKIEKASNLISIDSLNTIAKPIQHHYKIQNIKVTNKTIFSITCTGNFKNEFEDASNINWLNNSADMTTLQKNIFKQEWKNCMITREGKDFSIQFTDNASQKLKLDNTQLIFTPKIKRKKREAAKNQFYEKYISTYKEYIHVMNKIDSIRNKLHLKDTLIQREIDSLLKYNQYADSTVKMLNRDSLFCFWSTSKKFMPTNEQNQKFEEWIKFFDQNKSMMLERYQNLKTSDDFSTCEKTVKEKQAIAKQLEEQAKINKKYNQVGNNELNEFMKIGGSESNFKKGEDLKKTKLIFQSLSIGNLGVYNCDQISRLKDPVITINASYQDDKQNELTIILIYIIDNSFNGILRYDGLMNFGPVFFKCSASSKNTLIAFDEKFNAYIYKSENFENIKSSGSHKFILQKLTDIVSKTELNFK